MTGTVTVVGYDGSPLGADASRALAGATLVVGGRRHLDAVAVPATARTVVMGPLSPAVEELARHDGEAVVVASGDPGFFGIVRALREAGLDPRVLPGVSSVALAFARVGLPWDDALVVSAHGRDLAAAVNACRAHPKVAVLTGPGAGPAEIGAALGATARRMVVCERLGTDEERVTAISVQDTARAWADPNVTLVLDDERLATRVGSAWPRAAAPDAWALPESEFAHRDSMVTKAEVRALALARLAPRPGLLVWDVGAGSGSVAVECARFGAAVVAVERDADQCRRVDANARRHGVSVDVVAGSAPAALDTLPDPDAVFVGGGGPDVVAACARRKPARVVAALAAVDRLAPVRDALSGGGYAVDGTLLQSSRMRALPDGSTRLAAENPVLLVWGERL
ncbi:precorrin-6y C5,15-methyltransferase (decarboxylating) subunit CbiE [Motilibacter aurantiacus]|uniref:precorrin-6y C5,15-methyltransferase (decarboxylating) subunit CbiE n=1 Tax=Motilibacter aurantiacus TaxID=2714955 RepID=UPI00140D13CD|nr:precorrin-6y C5,15-methyltransferase (decarboxylating) subunit CbiE [Motilibacter aurantiacus]